MFRLAHFSDIHLGPLPGITYRELASKRITGYINWQRHRKISLDNGIIDRITEDMLAAEPDHIALTGDLVNLALEKEMQMARLWLESLGPPEDISIVPGNHDAYVPHALERACRAWGAYMSGDGSAISAPPTKRFPYLRERGPIALIGVSSARATAPFLASGYFTEKQARKTAALLERAGANGLFRVLLIHHPPVRHATGTHKRLFGISRFQKMIRRHGAELVLHGHTHLPTVHLIQGKNGMVPVVGVAAAGQAHGGGKPPAHYNLLEITGTPGAWRVQLTRRGPLDAQTRIGEISSHLLIPGERTPA